MYFKEENYPFNIVKHRRKFFWGSAIVIVLGLISLLISGLHLGVDFKSGTTLDLSISQAAERTKVDELFINAGHVPASVTIGGAGNDRITARFDKVLNQDEVNAVMGQFINAYGDQIAKEENTVDTDLARELATKAIWAVLIACLGIAIYVSIRFEWRFAVGAIVSTLYDALLVVGVFSIFRWEVNLPFVAAVLTIVGYSINDTIVIFDRVRENLRFSKAKSFDDYSELINRSIWQTMNRSINTVVTVLIGAVCLFIFGSEAIRIFSVAMIVGLISGAYSSIFIASPIWLILKGKSLVVKSTPK